MVENSEEKGFFLFSCLFGLYNGFIPVISGDFCRLRFGAGRLRDDAVAISEVEIIADCS